MHLEPIAGKQTDRLGWTVTWKGRGWHESFEAYLELFRGALAVEAERGMLVAPSVKYHLPGPDETVWKEAEYAYTTRKLLEVWQGAGRADAMPLEKDFSPTLSGDSRSKQQAKILEWMERCPQLIREGAGEQPISLGIKLMNATFDDAFQLEMTRLLIEQGTADYLIYANRLFDSAKEFEGKVGVAYGGPDLSARNLRLLTALRLAEQEGRLSRPVPPISGTGDVCSGKMALEYALRGCDSLQMHTLFQLPDQYYGRQRGSKSRKALIYLLFHPGSGLIPWMLHLKQTYGVTRFLEVAGLHRAPEGAALLRRARLD